MQFEGYMHISFSTLLSLFTLSYLAMIEHLLLLLLLLY